ncbi:copper resistance protein CopD [Pseudomonas chlororaphis]|uniref:copper homeostasis membrane protein CopD n=1 Tax=Pseudomonas chlororaphis TaxID=587753 RepID=UPI000F491037|nr:copper homeostasis membrane protein CopD [Pseudomonas chlororaphis]MCP1478995.1 putative copper resistance protein D [Pseudomonas chlororaphis]MCP1594653.1 putative copper resistance protein D [Pseudomonas chlororaphis]ROL81814.1 copper resistance protein CopD [Pseudomonas chlororaphis]
MGELINVALRFALYLDLTLLFGLALFSLYGLRGAQSQWRFRRSLATALVLGALLSGAALLQLALSMSGATSLAELDPALLSALMLETAVGQSWLLRLAALLLAGVLLLFSGGWPRFTLYSLILCTAAALATLAWGGHGAMSEGDRHYLHLGSDILHLLGAGAWLGALAAFALLLRRDACEDEPQAGHLLDALKGFASLGTLIVIVLTISGVLNYLLIVGPDLATLSASTYGLLLSLKVAVFASMLVFAALNRFHLVPQLEQALHHGSPAAALPALRRSMVLELAAALLIVGLVATLGILSPAPE